METRKSSNKQDLMKSPKDLHRNEFVLVDNLNKCRQLLWQTDHPPEVLSFRNQSVNEIFFSLF